LAENSFDNISSRIAGFQSQGEHLAAGGFHFFPAGDEVRPIGALDEDIRQNDGNQLARRILVEERDGIDGFERQASSARSRSRGSAAATAPWRGARTGIGVQRENENVAERAGLLEEPDVAGVKQVIAAVGEDHGFALALPAGRRCSRSSARL
jgi:hypothetical protein